MTTELKRMDGLTIFTPEGPMHGVDQDWYRLPWQRLAGCGPCTASNMLRYFGPRAGMHEALDSKEQMQALMQRVWGYVTPGLRGLNTTERFQEGMEQLLKEQGSQLRCRRLNIPPQPAARPDAAAVARFIREGLQADSPIAFLNLHRGQLYNLENWHWVTLTALHEGPHGLTATAADNGDQLTLDLSKWLQTSTLGGGFVACG